MLSPLKLTEAFGRVTDYWSPKVIGQVNDQLLKVAKLKGEFVWHAHDGEDELFYIVKGALRIEFDDGPVHLAQGDMLTVPRGVRHNPVADEECWVMLIEPASTKHTGDTVTERTRSLEDQLG
ncbi:cupin domain-containing protein [Sphingosinicella sp. BN140058]|uniref:cupin domain-containing protein n=1 Tax=Sphingosinicella sp. BN140058 TaxID=1892855 RepID=UPI0010139CEB|nr:cupin domain-containing protein [Sphingosinicella sp. BN140058]QAY76468.1 cupin domain-containing protein [Sphingosinicella sp. BN140058]